MHCFSVNRFASWPNLGIAFSWPPHSLAVFFHFARLQGTRIHDCTVVRQGSELRIHDLSAFFYYTPIPRQFDNLKERKNKKNLLTSKRFESVRAYSDIVRASSRYKTQNRSTTSTGRNSSWPRITVWTRIGHGIRCWSSLRTCPASTRTTSRCIPTSALAVPGDPQFTCPLKRFPLR